MSARSDRAELADLRAIGIQGRRQSMHGGGKHGCGLFRGGAGVPSFGVSQYKGGRMHGDSCMCDDCCGSSSDEDMEGGSRFLPRLPPATNMPIKRGPIKIYDPRPRNKGGARTSVRDTVNLRPVEGIDNFGNGELGYIDDRTGQLYNASDLAIVPFSGRVGDLPPLTVDVTTLANLQPSQMKVFNPAEAQARLGDIAGLSSPNAKTRMAALTKVAAAALALGIPIAALTAYLTSVNKGGPSGSSGSSGSSGVTGGPGGPGTGTGGPGTGGPVVHPPPPPPVVAPPRGGPIKKGKTAAKGGPMNPSEIAWYLRTGNLPESYYESSKLQKMAGSGKGDGRSRRAAIVREVMQKKGMKLIEASKYVKDNNLY